MDRAVAYESEDRPESRSGSLASGRVPLQPFGASHQTLADPVAHQHDVTTAFDLTEERNAQTLGASWPAPKLERHNYEVLPRVESPPQLRETIK